MQAKLIYSLDGAFLGEFPLEKERMTIGRRPGNDIHIDNLAISGEHAAITIFGNEAILKDLDSTNGTHVNGNAIKKHTLQHGDVIELGKYQLKYINEAVLYGKPVAASMEFEKTVMMRPAEHAALQAVAKRDDVPVMDSQVQVLPASVPQQIPEVQNTQEAQSAQQIPVSEVASSALPGREPPRSESDSTPLARILVMNGPSAGKALILSKTLTTLGKPGVQVAVLTRRPHGYFVTHVEGLNYPKVNGNSIGTQAHRLSNHDVIEIAGIKMGFSFADI